MGSSSIINNNLLRMDPVPDAAPSILIHLSCPLTDPLMYELLGWLKSSFQTEESKQSFGHPNITYQQLRK